MWLVYHRFWHTSPLLDYYGANIVKNVNRNYSFFFVGFHRPIQVLLDKYGLGTRNGTIDDPVYIANIELLKSQRLVIRTPLSRPWYHVIFNIGILISVMQCLCLETPPILVLVASLFDWLNVFFRELYLALYCWTPIVSCLKFKIIKKSVCKAKYAIVQGLRQPFHYFLSHYSDGIMSAMASQITGVTNVDLTVYSDANQRRHQSSASLASVTGMHRCPVNYRTKGQ